MPTSQRGRPSKIDKDELVSALDTLFAKYSKEKDDVDPRRSNMTVFWETYLEAARDEDEARPKDWDENTGSILTFVRPLFTSIYLLTVY